MFAVLLEDGHNPLLVVDLRDAPNRLQTQQTNNGKQLASSLPSIPSRSCLITRSRAVCANLSLDVGFRATSAKGLLPLPPPPTERMTLKTLYLLFRAAKALRQPFVPSTSI